MTEVTSLKIGEPVARTIAGAGDTRYKAHTPEGALFIHWMIRVCEFFS